MRPDNYHASLVRRCGFPALLAGALALAGCDYFGYTPIKEIAASPANFEGKEVKLKGKATRVTKFLGLRSFTVRDETGEISVVTEGALPPENSDVALKGTVKSAMIVSGKSVGLRVEETQRLR